MSFIDEGYGSVFLGEVPPEERGLTEMLERYEADKKRMRLAARKPQSRQQRQRHELNKAMNARLRRGFVGVDGEGHTDEVTGRPSYDLLRAGGDLLMTGRPLSYRECFDFLCNLPHGPTDPVYVAYFFSYDTAMMARTMPDEVMMELELRDKRPRYFKGGETKPVSFDGFEFDYLKNKYLKVRRVGETRWVTVNDVGSFFQCSFLQALEDWSIGTEEERALIKSNKARRNDFGAPDDEEIIYNALECRLLADLMQAFAKSCRDIRYMPDRWQGPGELASKMLDRHGLPTAKELEHLIPLDLYESANKSYFGGRFETSAVGYLPNPCFNLDIRSAYPDAFRKLPCLKHGTWELGREPTSDIALVFVDYIPAYDIVKRPMFWGLPHRNEIGNIDYPAFGRGWYWLHELQGAVHQLWSPLQAWSYVKHCDCQPYDFIEGLYLKRKAMKGNQGKTLKLALNSLYGKNAQSIGKPKYANPIYASMITSLVRTKLYAMVHTLSHCEDPANRCGEPVYYLATDGVIASTDGGIVSSDVLGEWEVEALTDDLLLVQPGMMIRRKGKNKTRGVPADKMSLYVAQFDAAWDFIAAGGQMDDPRAKVTIQFRQFTGLSQGVHLNRINEVGLWPDIPRDYSFMSPAKRKAVHWPEGNMLRNHPHDGVPYVESRGYDKDIGTWRDIDPDWYEMKRYTEGQPEEADWNADMDSIFRMEW